MNLKEMIARQQALIDGAKAENRDLNAEERKEFDSLQASIDAAKAATPAATPAPAADPEADTQRAVAAERQRISDITALCRDFGVDSDAFVREGKSLDEVRAAVLEQLRKDNAPVNARAAMTESEDDKYRAAATDGLVMRSGVHLDKPAEGSRDFRGMSLRDLAIDSMVRDGASASELMRKSSDELFADLQRTYFNPSASFPAIMDAAVEKSIVEMYTKVPTTFERITTKGSLTDFKVSPDHEYVIGGIGDFEEVPEGGELKNSTPRTELLPTRQLKTYGKQFSLTRQAFINDDIGLVTRVPGLYATAAKKTIDKQVYGILFNNPAVFDGVKLFHANHKNLIGTGAKPTQASIQEMILQMQKQTDQFGDAIYMTPAAIVVPVGYGFDLQVILHSAQVVGSSNNDINPLYNYPIQVIESPVLNAMAGTGACPWYLKADDASARGIQVDYLNGQETPTIRRMEAPGVLGFTWDIFLDWGISVRDFRGWVKNPGVALS